MMSDRDASPDKAGQLEPTPAPDEAPSRWGAGEFVDYYATQSESPATLRRFTGIRDTVLCVRRRQGQRVTSLDVADVGCGAATQAFIWARDGHRVRGVDINEALIELGARRAEEQGLPVALETGSATQLPWPDASFDVCLVPELLEHVSEWRTCLEEVMRVVRPGGTLYLSTTNRLCPRQEEFALPLYSWYPASLKRRYERLAVTTRPELVNHADFPAVHWFTFDTLREVLESSGFDVQDRFDVAELDGRSRAAAIMIRAIRRSRFLRLLAQVVTPYTLVVATRRGQAPAE